MGHDFGWGNCTQLLVKNWVKTPDAKCERRGDQPVADGLVLTADFQLILSKRAESVAGEQHQRIGEAAVYRYT